MRKSIIRASTVVNGLAAGISGGVAAVIQQGIGNVSGGSVLSVAIGGAAGAYIAVMIDLLRHWITAQAAHRQSTLRSPYSTDLEEGEIP